MQSMLYKLTKSMEPVRDIPVPQSLIKDSQSRNAAMPPRKGAASRSEYPQKIGHILQSALKQRNISLNFRDESLWKAWNRAVGPVIAAQTRVDRFDRETLFLKVSSPVWLHQLQFMKTDIVQRLNGMLGKELVKNLFFSIGDIAASKKMEIFSLQPGQHPLKDREKNLIEKWTASLVDRELAEIMKRAIANHLIRRKMDEGRKSP
jgi:predicted nucleic acid-binding Zn ribbon protein